MLLFFGCKKTLPPLPTELPPLTTEGKNTFGCLINGEIYVPVIRNMCFYTDIYFVFPEYPYYEFSVTTHRVVAQTDTVYDAEVGIYIASVRSIGVYDTIDASVKFNHEYFNTYNFYKNQKIEIVKYDTVNKIISGTFEFDAVSEDSVIVQVREGRFDLKLRP